MALFAQIALLVSSFFGVSSGPATTATVDQPTTDHIFCGCPADDVWLKKHPPTK